VVVDVYDLDRFEWRLYRREEFRQLAEGAGLTLLGVGQDFDARSVANAGAPRAQYVMERKV
jgi:hypothetical protein